MKEQVWFKARVISSHGKHSFVEKEANRAWTASTSRLAPEKVKKSTWLLAISLNVCKRPLNKFRSKKSNQDDLCFIAATN